MRSLFKPSLKRIMLINFDGMSVYTLDGDRLIHVARFSDDDAGFDNFRFYLADGRKTTTTILIDSVAEDFMVEQVAHAGVFDSSTLLNRKLEQHFRGTNYRSARVLGRMESGRKDDRVLFSALTKSQGIDPWIEILLEEEIPIQGITTPAYALCKVAKEYDLLSSDTILLVNWEKSGIRQTLIQKQKVMFSRLTPLPVNPSVNPAELIVDSCKQSQEYLERAGLIEFDTKLDVHVITPHLDAKDFAEFQSDNTFAGIYHRNSIDMMEIGRFGGAQNEITAVLLCLDWGIRTGELKNIYGPPPAIRFYHLKQAKRLITALSLASLVLGFLMSAPMFYNSLGRSANVDSILSDLNAVQQNYDALTAQFPQTPIPSDAMALAVSTYDILAAEIQNPVTMLAEVGRVLARFPTIQLSSLDWNLEPKDPESDFTDAILGGELMVDLHLYGVLAGSSSHQESSNRLDLLIAALSELPGVAVKTISLPIETRTDTEIATVLNDQSMDAEFALSVSRET